MIETQGDAMAFLDKNYLIGNTTGERLFSAIAALPVIDPHNHADVAEIAANNPYTDAWRLFAATDHYVWEVLRKREVPEELITGKASAKDKFLAMARVFPELAGNPVYEWIHLDLRRYFGIDELLGPATGEKIFAEVNRKLALPGFRPQALLTGPLNVETMCSTDDLIDTLEHHRTVNAAVGRTLVRPTWRPDRAMKIGAPGWREYISRVENRFGMKLDTFADLVEAMRRSHDHFAECGCRASDHGLEYPVGGDEADPAVADRVFRKAKNGDTLTGAEIDAYAGAFLVAAAELNAEKSWVTQLHIGAVRDVRAMLFNTIGPDSGGDVISNSIRLLPALPQFLNRFDDRLKVVLYCLDPGHTPTLASITRAFGGRTVLGSAWWLNDTPTGMLHQLEYIASVDLLSSFAGMVSDSRKLLSYGSRFEMFRRVLADVLGAMVERGQMPAEIAADLAVKIAYEGPKRFWNL